MLLHDGEELDDDLGGRADQDLTATALLGVVDGVKRIVEDGSLDHFDGVESRFSNRGIEGYEVSKYLQCPVLTPSVRNWVHNSQPPVVLERKECPFCINKGSSARAVVRKAYHPVLRSSYAVGYYTSKAEYAEFHGDCFLRLAGRL